MQQRDRFFVLTAAFMAFFFLCSFQIPILGHKKKKYETPITKDTLQPDKILFDRAIHDIEKGNYEIARLTLNTLINTYDTSEYLAKAKLAIADSWYREGGAHGLASAEAEYKDFILFYPNMEEAAQSQYRVCDIHYKQMDKADRDSSQAQRAEDECRQVMVGFPNSKYVPQAQQMLRDVQEVLADKEYKTGEYYHKKGSFPAAASRLKYVTAQYPLYSSSDGALWDLADSYRHMGDRFRNDEGDALTRIVRDYPLSYFADAAKDRLKTLELPIPQADPAAVARMNYERANATRPGMLHRSLGVLTGRPDTSPAAKSGAPIMTSIRPPTPVSVPEAAAGGASGISDVSVSATADTTALDQKPDARLGLSGAGMPAAAPAAPAATADATPAPTPVGADEHKASVGSNGQEVTAVSPVTPYGANRTLAAAAATPANAQVAPPTNHPLTKAQLDLQKKQQAAALKAARKQASQAIKQYGISTPPVSTTTPPGATPSAATAAATATPASGTPASVTPAPATAPHQ